MDLDRLEALKTDKNIKKDKLGAFVLPGDPVIYGNRNGISLDVVVKNTPTGITLLRGGLVHSCNIMKISNTTPLGVELKDEIEILKKSYDAHINAKAAKALRIVKYVIAVFEMKNDPSRRGLSIFIFDGPKKTIKEKIKTYFSKRDDAIFKFLKEDKNDPRGFIYSFSEPGDIDSAKILGEGLIRKFWTDLNFHIGKDENPVLTPEYISFLELGKECDLRNCDFQYFVNETILNEYPKIKETLDTSEEKFKSLPLSSKRDFSIPFQKDKWKYSYCDLMLTNTSVNTTNNDAVIVRDVERITSWYNDGLLIPLSMKILILRNVEDTHPDKYFYFSSVYSSIKNDSGEMKHDAIEYYKYLIEEITGEKLNK